MSKDKDNFLGRAGDVANEKLARHASWDAAEGVLRLAQANGIKITNIHSANELPMRTAVVTVATSVAWKVYRDQGGKEKMKVGDWDCASRPRDNFEDPH